MLGAMMAGKTLVIGAVALVVAGGAAFYAAKEKREQQQALLSLLGDSTAQLRKALSAPPPPELVAKLDGNLKAAKAPLSRRALSMHMAAASVRDSYWIRIASDLRKRVERDHFELDIALKALGTVLATLPETRRSLEPHASAALLLPDAEELEKTRRLTAR